MDSLIQFLYYHNISYEYPSQNSNSLTKNQNQFLSSNTQHQNFVSMVKRLSKCEPTSITALPKSKTSNLLSLFIPLFVRNLAQYDPINLNLALIRSNILIFQRIAKVKRILAVLYPEKNNKDNKHIQDLFQLWVQNALFPFSISGHIQKSLQKAVKILIQAGFLYQDYKIDHKDHYMFKTQELNKALIQNVYANQLDIKIQKFNSLPTDKKSKLIITKQKQKLDEYLIQCYGKDSLLAFRMIQTFKFISEKQLINKTLMDTIQLRKSLNKLIENGLISFYSQNARTTIYSAISQQKLTKLYIDKISQTILNMQTVLMSVEQSNMIGSKQKLIKIEAAILELDDLLLLFQI